MAMLPKSSRPNPWSRKRVQWSTVRSKEYDTYKWKQARKFFLNNPENVLCVQCLKYDRITPATDVDHKIPVNEGAAFWDQSNWQPLCSRCHKSKSAKESQRKG